MDIFISINLAMIGLCIYFLADFCEKKKFMNIFPTIPVIWLFWKAIANIVELLTIQT